MGALTHIGNAPTFMIYAIATERGVLMPSFFGYLAWSLTALGPVFAAVSYFFIMDGSLSSLWSALHQLHLP